MLNLIIVAKMTILDVSFFRIFSVPVIPLQYRMGKIVPMWLIQMIEQKV